MNDFDRNKQIREFFPDAGICPKCGRYYKLDEDGLIPVHRVLKRNGSNVTIDCKGRGNKPGVFK
jgi:hypothetical protein